MLTRSLRFNVLSSAMRKVRGCFLARLRSKVGGSLVERRRDGVVVTNCERLLRRDWDVGSRGEVALATGEGSGVLPAWGV